MLKCSYISFKLYFVFILLYIDLYYRAKRTTFVCKKGYLVFEQTYHKSLPVATAELLRVNPLVSALYIRSRADRIAISRTRQFEFEVKTHFNSRYGDLTIEVIPFLMHYAKRMFIDCLYVCSVNNREFGFWISKPPKIREVNIPPLNKNQYVKETINSFRNESMFRDVVWKEKIVNGSGDPYLVIDRSEICNLRDWKELL